MGKLSRKYWDKDGVALEGYPATNVQRLYQFFVGQLYDSVSRVILLDNIPDDNDYDFIMENLIMCGHIAAINTKSGFRLLNGVLGGKRNEFYRPTEIIVDNPLLGDIRALNDVEGKMIYLTPHDRLHTPPLGFGGLSDLIGSTAQLLADNTASINIAQINGRVLAVYSAGNQQEATAAEIVLKEMYKGQPYKVVSGQNILSKFDVNPIASTVTSAMLKELVELRQYILAQFWNAIGIDANFNMKRERLVSAEVEANATSLKVPISTILSELNAGFDICNEIFGTDIHARLNPEFKPLDEPVSKPEGGSNEGSNTYTQDTTGISSSDSETQDRLPTDSSGSDTGDTSEISGIGGQENSSNPQPAVSFGTAEDFITTVLRFSDGQSSIERSEESAATEQNSSDDGISGHGFDETGDSGFETESPEIEININIGGEDDAEVSNSESDKL